MLRGSCQPIKSTLPSYVPPNREIIQNIVDAFVVAAAVAAAAVAFVYYIGENRSVDFKKNNVDNIKIIVAARLARNLGIVTFKIPNWGNSVAYVYQQYTPVPSLVFLLLISIFFYKICGLTFQTKSFQRCPFSFSCTHDNRENFPTSRIQNKY